MQAFQPNKRYQWSVSLVCESEFVTDKATIEGVIERIELTAAMAKQLDKATPQEHAFIYAEAGIWNDALQSIDALKQLQPSDRTLTDNWRSLLTSAGIESMAKFSAR